MTRRLEMGLGILRSSYASSCDSGTLFGTTLRHYYSNCTLLLINNVGLIDTAYALILRSSL
jgi:hypothetical protein